MNINLNEKYGLSVSVISTTSTIIKSRSKDAAFRSWAQRLKASDRLPRGRFFKTQLAMKTKGLKIMRLEEPV